MAAYYLFLLKAALQRLWDFMSAQGLIIGIVLGVIGVVLDIAYAKFRGESENIQRWVFVGIGPPVGVVLVAFVYHLLHIPVEVWLKRSELDERIKQQQGEIVKLKEDRDTKQRRVLELTRLLPPLEIKRQQKEAIVAELKRLGPRSILIKYLEEPTSRAAAFANQLVEIFEALSWRVRLVGTGKPDVINKGFAITHVRVLTGPKVIIG